MINNICKRTTGLLLGVLLLSACNNDGNIKISGVYPSGAGEYLSLKMLNINEMQFIDSLKASSKGNFKFNLDLKNPELLALSNKEGEIINLLVFPEDEIHVEITEDAFSTGYNISGSEESEKIRKLVETMNITRFKLDSIRTALDEIEDMESPMAQVLVSTYQQVFLNQKRNNIRFVVENINSLSSVYALYQRVSPEIYLFDKVQDIQYLKIVADSIKVKYPGSTLTSSLVKDLQARLSEYNAMKVLDEFSKTEVVESGLIDLNIEDTDGETVSLKALKGKVVLLNFWASWDSKSRNSNRSLISIYNTYHNRGFEIYSVALDNDRNTWRRAIDFEEYPWINVSELTYPYSYAATSYNIESIPSNYLIDREGNIVARNISGKVLATWLDNLL